MIEVFFQICGSPSYIHVLYRRRMKIMSVEDTRDEQESRD